MTHISDNDPAVVPDDDLPGAWSHSDFLGGDPDERSYAERGWDPHPAFVQRFIVGIDPSAIDPEEIKGLNVLWQIPEPMTIQTRHLDPEVLEILFGGPVVPLCNREIPERGTE